MRIHRARKSPAYFIFHLFATSSLVAYLFGCSTTPPPAPEIVPAQHADKIPEVFQNRLSSLKNEMDRNAVVNLTDIAVTGMNNGLSLSEDQRKFLIDRPLDLAIERIEDIYSNTPEAQKALSYWHDENSKPFKGEPYERSFVFLLRGLRYYEVGDYGNAMACFKSGILQDSLSVEGKYNADMATFEWLIGLCEMKLGEGLAAVDSFKRAKELVQALPVPKYTDNTLVVVFSGTGPLKEQSGKYQDILVFTQKDVGTTQVELSKPSFGRLPVFYEAAMSDDMYFQATTRGGRPIDQVNEYKAIVKDTTKSVGWAFIIAGALCLGTALILASSKSGNGDATIIMVSVGGGLIVIGVTGHIVALCIKTKADTRNIAHVPGKIHLWSGLVSPGEQEIPVKITNVVDGTSNASPQLIFQKCIVSPNKKNNVVLVFNSYKDRDDKDEDK